MMPLNRAIAKYLAIWLFDLVIECAAQKRLIIFCTNICHTKSKCHFINSKISVLCTGLMYLLNDVHKSMLNALRSVQVSIRYGAKNITMDCFVHCSAVYTKELQTENTLY